MQTSWMPALQYRGNFDKVNVDRDLIGYLAHSKNMRGI